ncbi:recombinase family protein [Porticoccaceae bacterium LTM1]|nr:recombinase family protein [Porticoccaceae bacterium LTM1]
MSHGQKVGYARVSSYGQSLEVQLEKLNEYGCDEIFQEKRSGKRADTRPALQECLKYVRPGESLVVCKLDRLARSVADLHKIVEQLESKKATLKVLDQEIDTSTSTGKLMFNMLGAIAEFENDLRHERQMEGIAKAKSKGVQFGAKPKLSDDEIGRLRAEVAKGERSKSEIAKEFKIGRASLYRYLNTDTSEQ